MKALFNNFIKGCLVLVPTVATVYTVFLILRTVDNLLPLPFPGLGIVVSLVVITAIGAVASNVVGARVIEWIESQLKRLPVVRILFTAFKDFIGAFVGDRRMFAKPVMVRIGEVAEMRVLGFITCERFDDPKLDKHVAVYCPQSYNVAGNILIVPRDRVERIDADGAELMAFIVSGGVSGMHAAKTYLETAPPWRTRPY